MTGWNWDRIRRFSDPPDLCERMTFRFPFNGPASLPAHAFLSFTQTRDSSVIVSNETPSGGLGSVGPTSALVWFVFGSKDLIISEGTRVTSLFNFHSKIAESRFGPVRKTNPMEKMRHMQGWTCPSKLEDVRLEGATRCGESAIVKDWPHPFMFPNRRCLIPPFWYASHGKTRGTGHLL